VDDAVRVGDSEAVGLGVKLSQETVNDPSTKAAGIWSPFESSSRPDGRSRSVSAPGSIPMTSNNKLKRPPSPDTGVNLETDIRISPISSETFAIKNDPASSGPSVTPGGLTPEGMERMSGS